MNSALLYATFISLLFAISLQSQHINGLTAVATPGSFDNDPYKRIKQTNAQWACLVPYGFTRKEESTVHYNMDRQWWGEKKEGIIENITLLRQNEMKVMLKPQVYVPGGWPGDINFDSDNGWEEWEASYKAFILFYLDIAIAEEVEIFCIGTEFKHSVAQRPQFWKDLIQEMRKTYCGKLTYSANWDHYREISFWPYLDYIGVSAYFPLVNKKEPTVKQIKKAWEPWISDMAQYSEKQNIPILFTEYGYLTVDGCTYNTWELEKKVKSTAINEQAQANAFEALYSMLWDEPFWAGGFIWKWFPNDQGHEGYIPRDYTPKNKKAETVITKWFGKDKHN